MKNKKMILIIIFVLILIIIAVVLAMKLTNKEEKPKEDLTVTAKELLENNYYYYYYTYGDIKTSEENILIEDTIYYKVTDTNIKSIKEFNDMLNNSFISSIQVALTEETNKNTYIEIDGTLYVNKTDNPCKNIVKYDLSNITLEGDDLKKDIYFDETKSQMYYENESWKLGGNNYYCIEAE